MATAIITQGGTVVLDAAETIRRRIKAQVTRYKVERNPSGKTDFSPHIAPTNDVIEISGILSDSTFDADLTAVAVRDNRPGPKPDFLQNILGPNSFSQFEKSVNPKFTVYTSPETRFGEARKKSDLLEAAVKNRETVTLVEAFGTQNNPNDRITENLVITSFDPSRSVEIKGGYRVNITLEGIRTSKTTNVRVAASAVPSEEKAPLVGGETTSGADQTRKTKLTASELKRLWDNNNG